MTPISDALAQGRDISICWKCADANGAKWPIHHDKNGNSVPHVATWWGGDCDACGKGGPICALSDWEWPGRAGRRMRERREV